MAHYTRRKILHDLGIASASIAAAGIEGCCLCAPQADFYVLLQGPWLLSYANDIYLRAATAKLPDHVYSYFDPHPNPWPAVPDDHPKDGSPILQAPSATYLTTAQLVHFKVDRGCDCEQSWSFAKRSHLFDAMRDQAQGLFYSKEVWLDGALQPLEVHLSYPDAVFAMDIQRNFSFTNLDYVVEKQVNEWPSTIVLRYRNWKSATFSGNNVPVLTVPAGIDQVHRKFGISYPLPSPQGADLPQPPADAASPFANEMDASWASVMRLLKFKYEKVPKPTFHCKTVSECDPLKAPSDSVITQNELDCLPPPPTPLCPGTKLVASLAGSAGVHGG